MRRIYSVAIMVGLAFGGLGVRAEDAKDDLEAMQGTWELTYFERDGMEVKLQASTKAVNTGDKFVVKRGEEIVAAGSFKFDATKKPKASETTYSEGPDKGKTFKGIYQIDRDTMKFCRAGSPEGERPTEFKTKPGSKQFSAVYKRVKK